MSKSLFLWASSIGCFVIFICALAYLRIHRERLSWPVTILIGFVIAAAGTNAAEPLLPWGIQPEARVTLIVLIALSCITHFIARKFYQSDIYKDLQAQGKAKGRRSKEGDDGNKN